MLAAASRSRERFGALGCGADVGFDLAKFQATQRAPLFTNQWNRWVLARTTRDNPDDDTVRRTLIAVFKKWSSAYDLEWGPAEVLGDWTITDGPRAGHLTHRIGHFDLIDVQKIDRSKDAPMLPLAQVAPMPPPSKLRATRGSVDPLPMLSTSTAIWVVVDFVYRGSGQSMPWPIWNDASWQHGCPWGADWIAWDISRPLTEAAPTAKTAAGKAGATVEKLVPPIALGGLALAAAAAIGAVLALRAMK
jgi:hypothetical protein